MRHSTIFPGLLMLLLSPVGAAAQVPGVDLKLLPKIGGFTAINSLQEVTTAEGDLTRSLEPALALGLGVELAVPGLPGLRANLDYASSAKLEQEGGFTAGDVDDVRLIAVVADIVLRRGGLGLSPYLLLGGGLKWYDFPEDFTSLEDSSDLTGHVGAGLELDLEFLGLFLEVSDYISTFTSEEDGESRFQNDIFGMVGIRVGLL